MYQFYQPVSNGHDGAYADAIFYGHDDVRGVDHAVVDEWIGVIVCEANLRTIVPVI